MAIEDTSLQQEIDKILGAGEKDSHYYWDCEIHTANETLSTERVLSVDIIRDYDANLSDDLRLEVAMPKGQFISKVVRFRNNLTATLRKFPLGENSENGDTSRPIDVIRMRALLLSDNNPLAEGNAEQAQYESTMDLTGLVRVEFQLMDLAIEKLRLKTTGAIFRNAVPAKALQGLLGELSKNISVPAPAEIKGVDLVEPDNTNERAHVIIPHGTKVTSLPGYVQRHCGGVYNKGMGYFLQSGLWYLYPLFAMNRFSETSRTLSIISVAKNRYPHLDRTYLKEGDKLVMLSTGGVKFHDDSEKQQINQGNGVRYADASKCLEDLVEIDNNRAIMSRSDRAAEYLIHKREDGQNAVFFSEQRITDNHPQQASQLARRMGSHAEVVWENSDPDLIYPGMPFRYFYQDSSEVKYLEGTVLRAHSYISLVGRGVGTTRHSTNTQLVLFIEKPELNREQ